MTSSLQGNETRPPANVACSLESRLDGARTRSCDSKVLSGNGKNCPGLLLNQIDGCMGVDGGNRKVNEEEAWNCAEKIASNVEHPDCLGAASDGLHDNDMQEDGDSTSGAYENAPMTQTNTTHRKSSSSMENVRIFWLKPKLISFNNVDEAVAIAECMLSIIYSGH